MKTNLSLSNPAEVETECLVAIVLEADELDPGEFLTEVGAVLPNSG